MRSRPGIAAALSGSRLSLRRRVQLVVSSLVALLVLCGLVATLASAAVDRSYRSVAERWLPVAVDLEQLGRAYLDQQSAVRGFALTGQRSFPQQYVAAVAEIEAHHRRLGEVLAAEPQALAAFAAVREAYQTWRSGAVDGVLTQLEQGEVAQAQRFIESGVGRRLFDELRDRLDVLRTAVQDLVAVASRHFNATRSWAVSVILGTVGVALLLGGFTLVGLRRSVTRPLAALVSGICAVADGAVERPVRASGPAEIASIGAAAEQMRVSLLQHISEATESENRIATLQAGERIAAELARRVIERLFAVSLALSSMANRHPELATQLLGRVRDLDATIGDLRRAVFDLAPEAASRHARLSDRVADLIGDLERALGSAPAIRVDGPVDDAVTVRIADEVLAVLRGALSYGDVAAGSVDQAEVTVRLAVVDAEFHLQLIQDRPLATGWDRVGPWSAAAAGARQLGGTCTSRRDADGRTTVDWAVPVPR